MASSKELNILIQAQLDKGNTVDAAKGLGKDIASAIEEAFSGLGEKIAANLIMEMRGMLSNMKFKDLLSDDVQTTAFLKQKSVGQSEIQNSPLVLNDQFRNTSNTNAPWWNSFYAQSGTGSGNPSGHSVGPSPGPVISVPGSSYA